MSEHLHDERAPAPPGVSPHAGRRIGRFTVQAVVGGRARGPAVERDGVGRGLPWVNLAVAREQSGDDDGALADLARAIEVDPGDPESYHIRAGIRLRRGDREGALEDVEFALRRGPAARKRAHLERLRERLRR